MLYNTKLKTNPPAAAPPVSSAPLRYLKGVGPRRAGLLKRLGLETVEDLIFQPPRGWEDRRLPLESNGKQEGIFHGKGKTVLCQILETKISLAPNRSIAFFKARARSLAFLAKEGTEASGPLTLSWIRRVSHRYDTLQKLKREVSAGATLLIYGRQDMAGGDAEIQVEDYCLVNQGEFGASSGYVTSKNSSPHWLRIVPLYPSTEGISQKILQRLRWDAIQAIGPSFPHWDWQTMPNGQAFSHFLSIGEAYRGVHFPNSEKELDLAKKTLACWEFLLLAVAMELRRNSMRNVKKLHQYHPEPQEPQMFHQFAKDLGFSLTMGQESAIAEILASMKQPTPMNRLLQGEVGSGKTIVALAAICLALESGHQAAFIAPTEILIFQHFLTFKKYLGPIGIKMAALTSDTPGAQRERILSEVKSGGVQLLLGTHALLDPEVHFRSLALVIMDEQHRFGVGQRWALRSKTRTPDCLVISATPIPRTQALAIYGDLDISTIAELPQGREIPQTLLVEDEAEAWITVQEHLKKGFQAYVVVPAIEEENAYYNLEKETKRVAQFFENYSVGSLHGQMGAHEKENVMTRFASGEFSILVATTVIEVGIDVPQATVIVILGAERYGLATLHQLRGRVGRGAGGGFCILVTSPNFTTASSDLFSRNATLERLRRFVQTTSGFDIGRLDLEMRGPGKLLGLAQHGNWDFDHFDFERHAEFIEPLRASASSIVKSDPSLGRHFFLKNALTRKFGHHFQKSEIS